MLKKKSIIISAGCSFTDRFFKSHVDTLPKEKRGGWHIWTDHFKDKLEKHHNEKYEIIYTGTSGGSLDFSLDHIARNIAIYKDRIKFVLWGGTEWGRWMDHHTHMRVNPIMALRSSKPIKNSEGSLIPKVNDPFDYVSLLYDAGAAVVMRWYCQQQGRINVLNNSFRQLWTVFNLCKQYNITLIYYQLLDPMQEVIWMRHEFKRVLNEKNDYKLGIDFKADEKWEMGDVAVKSPWFKDLLQNKKHFYGLKYVEPALKHWSWEVRHEGVEFDLIVAPPSELGIVRDMPRTDKGDPVGIDFHPNAKGHKDIANKLWKHYETNFL